MRGCWNWSHAIRIYTKINMVSFSHFATPAYLWVYQKALDGFPYNKINFTFKTSGMLVMYSVLKQLILQSGGLLSLLPKISDSCLCVFITYEVFLLPTVCHTNSKCEIFSAISCPRKDSFIVLNRALRIHGNKTEKHQ